MKMTSECIGREKIYRTADFVTARDADQLGTRPLSIRAGGVNLVDGRRAYIGAVWSGEKRCPKRGEWYLSGAKIAAYRAPNDLNASFHIARLVPVVVVPAKHIAVSNDLIGEPR